MTESTKPHNKLPTKALIIGCAVLFLASIILVLLALGIFTRSLVITIEPDEVAVVLSPYEPHGYSEVPWTPGKHMLRPMEKVEIFKVSHQVFSSSSTDCNCGPDFVTLRAQDGVEVVIDYQVVYVIDSKRVVELYRVWQHKYQDGFVRPQSKQVTKQVARQYASNEIALTKREEIERAIFSRLESEFSEAHLILLEFKISDVRLND